MTWDECINGTYTKDDLQWILSEKSYLNIGEFITNRQEHASGLGASCDVFSAWSDKHNKKVAVKRIRAFLLKDKKFAKRLAREIRIWASLEHENVLPLLGYFVEGEKKLPNLVSPWMVNGSLHEYMKMFARSSFKTCKMLQGIASGLAYLHSRGVIHADLKSQNVLISSDGTPLLADFGLSLTMSDSQAMTTTSARGSLRWMAPELFRSDSGGKPSKQNKTSDVWAFGMLAYELLTWKIPYFDKRGDHLVMLAIMNGLLPDQVDSDETDNPHIFRWIWDCCNACWRHDHMIRPTAVQLEHLWSTASSLDLFERILMKEDPHAFLSSNLCWPFWASELQTAFFDIGVVANPGLASDSESNKYLSAILGSDSKDFDSSVRSPPDYGVQTVYPLKDTSSVTVEGPFRAHLNPSTLVDGSPMSVDNWTQKVLRWNSKHGSPMSIDDLLVYNHDRQRVLGQFKGSPMAIDIP